MVSIRDQLLGLFESFSDNDVRLIEELNNLIAKEGKGVYSLIFQILTNLDIHPDEAEKHWQKIITDYQDLGSAMGRDVNLRTAVCDYFCTINKSLHNPKIIEIHIFEKASRSSTFDSLTGLLNRNAFDETLKREVSRAKRYDTSLTLLFLDLDDFKSVNDTQGHIAGDEVLKKVARLIMAEKRSEDIAARFGGEEMIVLLPETSKADGWLLAERIRKKVEETEILFEGNTIKITVCGGLASFPIDASDDLTLLKNADLAMYRAKSFGKNNISFFSLNKRKNVRVDYCTDVEFQELGIPEKPLHPATTKSLSIGGILLESKNSLDIGAKIQIRITLDPDKPLLIIGTVIRSIKMKSDRHEISVAFLESDKDIRNEVSNYLIKHLKDLSPRISDAAPTP
ncbi:MAG: diguanylate cyclase [Deltaproteobacteria bacterium]|jgi:diguanylate cyclase (GGDEF)-like protein|nr:diguanylate cyclase [Deltaproteobacteria bacterium]